MIEKETQIATQGFDDNAIVERVSMVGIIGNVMLVAFKLFAGLVGHSSAMISDALHSLSDVLGTFVAYLGVTISESPADKSHPYGHERIEELASLTIGLILFGTGVGVGYAGVHHIVTGAYEDAPLPSGLPLAAAIVSIVVKEAMFWYTRRYAKILNSSAFMADAWHHRTDALSSVGSLIGVVLARCGLPIMDPIASVAICLFILKVSYDILKDCVGRIVDSSCEEDFEERVAERILSNESVDRLDLLRTRRFGSRVYVEAEISVDGNKTLYVAHRIAHEVHNAVEKEFPAVKHIMIHVNPTQLTDADANVERNSRAD